jgi:hypothetical protein
VCDDRIQVSQQHAASFDSAVVADLVGIGSIDTMTVSGSVTGVLRATRSLVLVNGANVTGLLVAPIVRILAPGPPDDVGQGRGRGRGSGAPGN